MLHERKREHRKISIERSQNREKTIEEINKEKIQRKNTRKINKTKP
jgi:hypothetical protein